MLKNTTSSCKRNDLLLDKQRRILLGKLSSGEISLGRGKHKETSLADLETQDEVPITRHYISLNQCGMK